MTAGQGADADRSGCGGGRHAAPFLFVNRIIIIAVQVPRAEFAAERARDESPVGLFSIVFKDSRRCERFGVAIAAHRFILERKGKRKCECGKIRGDPLFH